MLFGGRKAARLAGTLQKRVHQIEQDTKQLGRVLAERGREEERDPADTAHDNGFLGGMQLALHIMRGVDVDVQIRKFEGSSVRLRYNAVLRTDRSESNCP